MPVAQPYLKNHTLHVFSQSLATENKFIEDGQHLPVLHSLNEKLNECGLMIDYETIQEYYGKDSLSVFKNKSGIDISFDLLQAKSLIVKKEDFTVDMKIRFFTTSAVYDDFLAEIVSQDFGHYSNKMPVPGWAVCNHKVNDAILYIIPALNKAALVMRKELNEGFQKRRFADKNRKIAKNGRYNTISVPIPWSRLTKVCPSTIIFNYE